MSAFDNVMSNGFRFRDGKGVCFETVCDLKNIKRFASFSIPSDIRFSVLEHSAVCGLIVPKYCKFKNYVNQYSYNLMCLVLSHDLEEICLNDIPSPVKIEGLEKVKNDIRLVFRNYLEIKNDFIEEYSSLLEEDVRNIDMIAALVEILKYEKYLHRTTFKELFSHYVHKLEELKLMNFVENEIF